MSTSNIISPLNINKRYLQNESSTQKTATLAHKIGSSAFTGSKHHTNSASRPLKRQKTPIISTLQLSKRKSLNEEDIDSFMIAKKICDFSEAVNLLVQEGEDLTPALLSFVTSRCTSLVKCLLKAGVNPDLAQIRAGTLLHHACINTNKDLELLKILIETTENINATDKSGETALFFAVEHGTPEIVQEYMNHKANPLVLNLEGLTPSEFVEHIIEKERVKFAKTSKCRTKLIEIRSEKIHQYKISPKEQAVEKQKTSKFPQELHHNEDNTHSKETVKARIKFLEEEIEQIQNKYEMLSISHQQFIENKKKIYNILKTAEEQCIF